MRRVILSDLDRVADWMALAGELIVLGCALWLISLPVQYVVHRMALHHPCVIVVFGKPVAGP